MLFNDRIVFAAGQNWWQVSPTGPKAVRTLVLESIRDAPTRKQMLESVRGTSVTEDAIAIESSNRCAALLTRRSVHVCFALLSSISFALLNSIRSVLTDAQTCRQFCDNHALDTEHGMRRLQMETTWAVPGQRHRYRTEVGTRLHFATLIPWFRKPMERYSPAAYTCTSTL